MVFPKSGPTFTALLVDVDQKTYRFAEVAVLSDGVERSAPGETYIGRENVAYLQRATPTVG